MSAVPILLVEDDENDVFFFRRAMRKAGLTNSLHLAMDGREALHYLAGTGPFEDRTAHPLPQLVVLDINLPHHTGLEVLQWIRAQAALRTLIVIILTSSSSLSDLREAYTLGVNSYLLKPGNPEDMVALLDLVNRYWLGVNQRLEPATEEKIS